MTALSLTLALHLPVPVRTPVSACLEQRVHHTHRNHSNTLPKPAAADSLHPQPPDTGLPLASHRTAHPQIPIAQRSG